MKKLRNLLVVGGAALFLASCSMTMPITATSNAVGSKVGKSSGSCYLGAWPFGLCFGVDASIQSAAKNGGITEISTVDMQMKNVLNLIVTYETIVTGK